MGAEFSAVKSIPTVLIIKIFRKLGIEPVGGCEPKIFFAFINSILSFFIIYLDWRFAA